MYGVLRAYSVPSPQFLPKYVTLLPYTRTGVSWQGTYNIFAKFGPSRSSFRQSVYFHVIGTTLETTWCLPTYVSQHGVQ